MNSEDNTKEATNSVFPFQKEPICRWKHTWSKRSQREVGQDVWEREESF
jgi:hypothetical protein